MSEPGNLIASQRFGRQLLSTGALRLRSNDTIAKVRALTESRTHDDKYRFLPVRPDRSWVAESDGDRGEALMVACAEAALRHRLPSISPYNFAAGALSTYQT
jgi:hypothetical protein